MKTVMKPDYKTRRARQSSPRLLMTASLGCAVTVLDTNLVGMVLPAIAQDLQATFADIEWVVSAYLLCFAAFLLPAGAIADLSGRKRVLQTGLGIFTVASLACGAAPTAMGLYIARAAQGIGAAFLLAPSLAIIGHTFHGESEKARVWAVWGAMMGLTMVLSPLFGGAISHWLGWRWAFYVNIPVCLALLTAVARWIPESRNPERNAPDLPGIVLFAATMFVLTSALINAPVEGWTSVNVITRALAGIGLLGLFVRFQQRASAPMLDLELFRNRRFIGAVIAMLAYAGAAQVMASLLPLYLQNARGATALQAGAGMLPFALGMLALPYVGRKLAGVMPSFHILTLGLAIVAIGNFILMWSAFFADNMALVVIGMAVLGSGGGLLNGETQKAIMGSVQPHRAGMASGISTTSRFCGILLGFACLGSILASNTRSALQGSASRLGLRLTPETIERLVAGDLSRAMAGADTQLVPMLERLMRLGFNAGFVYAYLAAALVASTAAITVYACMRSEPPAP